MFQGGDSGSAWPLFVGPRGPPLLASIPLLGTVLPGNRNPSGQRVWAFLVCVCVCVCVCERERERETERERERILPGGKKGKKNKVNI